jgi:hypothetical protein
MLLKLYPKVHRRYTSLPILGPILDGFGTWLLKQVYLPKTRSTASRLATDFWKAHSIQLRRRTPLFEGRTVAERAWRDERPGRAAIRAGRRTFGRGWSGGVSFVPVMKAADLRDRHDAALAVRSDRARNRRVLVE